MPKGKKLKFQPPKDAPRWPLPADKPLTEEERKIIRVLARQAAQDWLDGKLKI